MGFGLQSPVDIQGSFGQMFSSMSISQALEAVQKKHPKDPAVLKTLRDIELLRHGVFTTAPLYLLRCKPCSERRDACKPRKMMSAQGVEIVNHSAMVNLLLIVNLLRLNEFSTAVSSGWKWC